MIFRTTKNLNFEISEKEFDNIQLLKENTVFKEEAARTKELLSEIGCDL